MCLFLWLFERPCVLSLHACRTFSCRGRCRLVVLTGPSCHIFSAVPASDRELEMSLSEWRFPFFKIRPFYRCLAGFDVFTLRPYKSQPRLYCLKNFIVKTCFWICRIFGHSPIVISKLGNNKISPPPAGRDFFSSFFLRC